MFWLFKHLPLPQSMVFCDGSPRKLTQAGISILPQGPLRVGRGQSDVVFGAGVPHADHLPKLLAYREKASPTGDGVVQEKAQKSTDKHARGQQHLDDLVQLENP